jgi:RNA polymerase sigma factor (sigma-70 family)
MRVVPFTRAGASDEKAAAAAEARLLDLLARYGSFLRRTIVKLCPTSIGLSFEDIEQDARVRLWNALKSEREITYPGSYIYKVAVSATIRAIRRAKARREEHLRDPEPGDSGGAGDALAASPEQSPEAIAERREWLRKIDAALGCLPQNRQLAVGLHLQGLTTREIGDILGWTEPKARNLVHRGLKDLRSHLRAAGIDYE